MSLLLTLVVLLAKSSECPSKRAACCLEKQHRANREAANQILNCIEKNLASTNGHIVIISSTRQVLVFETLEKGQLGQCRVSARRCCHRFKELVVCGRLRNIRQTKDCHHFGL